MDTWIKPAITVAVSLAVFCVGARVLRAWAEPRMCKNVALLGDSLTAGLEYRAVLEDLLGPCNTVQAFGYPNQQTAVIESRLPLVLASGPTDVVVLAGVNDLASGKSVESIINRLDRMYSNLQSTGIRVTAVTLLKTLEIKMDDVREDSSVVEMPYNRPSPSLGKDGPLIIPKWFWKTIAALIGSGVLTSAFYVLNRMAGQ